jgi:hypothetical protein
MAYLIDSSYFQSGRCAINNVESTSWAGTSKSADIASYIAIYEPEYLTKLLGRTLYDYVMAHPTEARIVTLIAKLRDKDKCTSPIACYVYYMYTQQSQVVQTESGDKDSAPSGMTSMANLSRHVSLWNSMVTSSVSISDWLEENVSIYPEYEETSDDDLDPYDIFHNINVIGL